jgi:uncharacterized membrane protein YhaH (DUF805 family)
MDFVTSVTTVLKKYVDFKGRASRSEYWWFALAALIVYIVLSFVSLPLYGIAALLLLLPTLAVGVRRLHDMGKTGWWMLIAIVPLVNLLLLYFAVQPSEQGTNQWGDQPAETVGA